MTGIKQIDDAIDFSQAAALTRQRRRLAAP